MNELIKKIKKDVDYMKNSHVNDPKTPDLIDEIEAVLIQNVDKSIDVLNTLDRLHIEWICPTFEKVSYKLQSKALVDCLEGLLEKFSPEINGFKNEVQEAKEAYYGN